MIRKKDHVSDTQVQSLEQEIATEQTPDGGYGWVVVAASFFVHALILGNIYSFGVFFPIYIDDFNQPQGSVAWVGSIGAGLMTGLGAYSGAWADEYGNSRVVFIGGSLVGLGYFAASFSTQLWHLYLTQGFIAGIGYSLAFISGVSVVGQWFTARRGLATGIAVAGSGLGQFAISLFVGAFTIDFGWRTTLRYLALIVFVGLTLCSVAIKRFVPCCKPDPTESGLAYFKERNFVLLYFSAFFSTLGLFMPYTHIPIYAELHGINNSEAILMLSIMGIASAAGRVLIGFVADVYGKIAVLQLCIAVGGLSTLCWMGCTSFITILLYGIVFGFFAGGVISLFPTVCAELYGIKKLGSVIGVLYTGTAAGNLLSAPIGGFLYDATGNYYASISVAGGFLLFSCLFLFSIDKTRTYEVRMSQRLSALRSTSDYNLIYTEGGGGDNNINITTTNISGSISKSNSLQNMLCSDNSNSDSSVVTIRCKTNNTDNNEDNRIPSYNYAFDEAFSIDLTVFSKQSLQIGV